LSFGTGVNAPGAVGEQFPESHGAHATPPQGEQGAPHGEQDGAHVEQALQPTGP
jgi:hypothetical protein